MYTCIIVLRVRIKVMMCTCDIGEKRDEAVQDPESSVEARHGLVVVKQEDARHSHRTKPRVQTGNKNNASEMFLF